MASPYVVQIGDLPLYLAHMKVRKNLLLQPPRPERFFNDKQKVFTQQSVSDGHHDGMDGKDGWVKGLICVDNGTATNTQFNAILAGNDLPKGNSFWQLSEERMMQYMFNKYVSGANGHNPNYIVPVANTAPVPRHSFNIINEKYQTAILGTGKTFAEWDANDDDSPTRKEGKKV